MAEKKWQYLRKGDIVDVIAPGFACSHEDVENARKFILSWGLQPRIPTDVLSPHFLHAAEDEIRLRHLTEALLAKDSTAVWCLRGGYGANRLIPRLAKVRPPQKAKLLLGLSDVTSIHLFLQQSWKWASLHASLLDRLGKDKVPRRDVLALRQLVFGKQKQISHDKLKPMNGAAENARVLKGSVVGGNAVVLQSSLGTKWEVQTKGKILFLEEIGERGYRVDRVLEHFHQAGVLQGCRGVLLGQFIGGNEPSGGNLVQKVLQRFALDYPKIPVFSGVQAGHDMRQAPLPLGTRAEILKSKNGFRLLVESGGKST